MKRFMALVMAIVLIMPLANVNAATYKQYTVGEEVNFYAYEGDSTGVTTFILEDKGTEDQYVKTFVVGLSGSSSQGYADGLVADPTDFKTTLAYTSLMNIINAPAPAGGNGLSHARNVADEATLISLDELKSVFGATVNEDGSAYTIDVAKYGKIFEAIPNKDEKGIFTSTVEEGKVWAVKFTYDDPTSSERKITSLSVEKVDLDSDEYSIVPVVYFDKTYDCHYKEVEREYSCYDCNGDYLWVEVGKQADTCKLITDIQVRDKCVKSPKTGIEEYALEFAIVAIICGISLVFIKRKDLFKEI